MINRIGKLLEVIPSGMDAVFITSSINRRYYTGFPSSAGTLVITKEQSYFIIDSRYFEAASAKIDSCEVVLQDKLYEQIGDLLKKHAVKTIGVESDAVSMSEFAKLKGKLAGFEIFPDDRVSKLIAKQRSVKSKDEIASIMAAQEIADKTFSHFMSFVKPGRTELEIAIEMEQYSRRNGSEAPAFDYIVASGANSSMPHAVPSGNAVKSGDFITIDFGATVDGYRSDMTRTVAIGKISDKQREVYEIVLKAQLAALEAVKAGVVCSGVDKIARDIIDATAYEGLFGHGLGHSLGLEIHEPPRFSKDCNDILEAGVVISVEPGIYIPGEFGVRIEDIVAVEESGCNNLTKSPKELIIL